MIEAEKAPKLVEKPYRALQFSGIAPTNRTAEEVEADLSTMRDAWDEREAAWRAIAPSNISTPQGTPDTI